MIKVKGIAKLNESVINRIAAEEIIHHPCNIVKELMENSLDAGSSSISITLAAGGVDLIKVKDNGSGIQVKDLPLACERYATSKMQKFQDLNRLTTFGFRGEALASISHIANVTIVTKNADTPYAIKATYADGKMISGQKCAGNQGTIITAQNLFKFVPARAKALKSANEEYNCILDCVQKYAIHNTNVSFTLVKDNNNTTLSVSNAADQFKRIQQIYGLDISRHLNTAEFEDDKCKFKMYYTKIKEQPCIAHSIFIFFVNDRLVDNSRIKKQVKSVYGSIKSSYKPKFIYIQLTINPHHVDVNVHPTKNKVHLLNEDMIAKSLSQVLFDSLNDAATKEVKQPSPRTKTKGKKQALPENQTIKHYFKPITDPIAAEEAMSSMSDSVSSVIETPPQSPAKINLQPYDNDGFNNVDESFKMPSYKLTKTASLVYHKNNDTIPKNIRILQQDIDMKEDSRISKLLQKCSDTGSIDQLIKLVKFKEKYYLIQTSILSKEYFYQSILSKFGSFGKLKLIPPLSVQACLSLVNPVKDVNVLALELYSKKGFLSSNFKTDLIFENDNIYLKSLPLLGNNYIPTLERIPLFIFNISTKVDWECELECLGAIAYELALLNNCNTQSQWVIVQDEIMKGGFKAPKYLASEGFIAEFDIPQAMYLA